jgi:hypothetical protein
MTGSVSLYDGRAFFEKALIHGVQTGTINQAKLDAICAEAPKGMVQIARYFGSEYLRPELERAKERIINLVSLHLEHSTGGDLTKAAQALSDHTFLSRSKAGSDMLKALIVMPQNSHFGMQEHRTFHDDHIPILAKWTLRSLPEYQSEYAKRHHVAQLIDAAVLLSESLGLDIDALVEEGKDAEAVIRTALLAQACKQTEMPSWERFEKWITALRKKFGSNTTALKIEAPSNLPVALRSSIEPVLESLQKDLPRILDASTPVKKLFRQTPAFLDRYFWTEDGLAEVVQFDRELSQEWTKATEGHSDEGSLLTLFLCLASKSKAQTVLSEKSAGALIRKIRKSGMDASLASAFIQLHAPHHYQLDYLSMWEEFVEEAQNILASDHDYTLNDALALLRRECNVK